MAAHHQVNVRCLPLSVSLSYSLSLSLSHTPSHILSLSHTHTHTHTPSHILTHTHIGRHVQRHLQDNNRRRNVFETRPIDHSQSHVRYRDCAWGVWVLACPDWGRRKRLPRASFEVQSHFSDCDGEERYGLHGQHEFGRQDR